MVLDGRDQSMHLGEMRLFEFLDKLGHRQGRGQRYEKMHMVGHTADTVKTASFVVVETKHVGVQLSLVVLDYGRNATVCAEDDVIGCLCIAHNFACCFLYLLLFCL